MCTHLHNPLSIIRLETLQAVLKTFVILSHATIRSKDKRQGDCLFYLKHSFLAYFVFFEKVGVDFPVWLEELKCVTRVLKNAV